MMTGPQQMILTDMINNGKLGFPERWSKAKNKKPKILIKVFQDFFYENFSHINLRKPKYFLLDPPGITPLCTIPCPETISCPRTSLLSLYWHGHPCCHYAH